MTDRVDIIFAQVLDCYVEIEYHTKLSSIRFINNKKYLKEIKTLDASFELEQYFKGERTAFSCAIDLSGFSAFAQRVLDETRNIKYGKTITYSELAKRIGCQAARAVGRALANNPVPIIIPCHRVVAKNGIGGYSGGVNTKMKLLEHEEKTLKANNL